MGLLGDIGLKRTALIGLAILVLGMGLVFWPLACAVNRLAGKM